MQVSKDTATEPRSSDLRLRWNPLRSGGSMARRASATKAWAGKLSACRAPTPRVLRGTGVRQAQPSFQTAINNAKMRKLLWPDRCVKFRKAL